MAAVAGVLSALERNWEMVDGTLAGLDDATLARRLTDQCNSIAWLLWHMTRVVGHIRPYAIASAAAGVDPGRLAHQVRHGA
jgi:Protein of unknown function (DUF664)